jgi:hypothetical protein
MNTSSMSSNPSALILFRDKEKKASMADSSLERFERPDKETTQGMFAGSYKKLDSDGLAPPVSVCINDFRVVLKAYLFSFTLATSNTLDTGGSSLLTIGSCLFCTLVAS